MGKQKITKGLNEKAVLGTTYQNLINAIRADNPAALMKLVKKITLILIIKTLMVIL